MTWALPAAAFCLGVALYLLLRDWDDWPRLSAQRKTVIVIAVVNGVLVGVAVAVSVLREGP